MQLLRLVGKYPEATVSLSSTTPYDSTQPQENAFDVLRPTFARSLNDMIQPFPTSFMVTGLISSISNYYTFDFVYTYDTNLTSLHLATLAHGNITPTKTIPRSARAQDAYWDLSTPVIQKFVQQRGSESYPGGDRRGTVNELYFFKKLSSTPLYAQNVTVQQTNAQKVHTLRNNNKYIINTGGTGWKITFTYKAHMADDVAMLDTLFNTDEIFYLWLNGGDDAIIKQKISPWKVDELLPVRIEKKRTPSFYKNLVFSGFNDKIDLVVVEELL